MPIKKYALTFCCIGLAGLGFGAAIFHFSENVSRNPASILPAPQVKKGNWRLADSGFVGKPQRTMSVSITAVHGVPSEDSQELVLRADVTLMQPLGRDIEYKWILPEGAVVVEGNMEDVWQDLQPGQTVSAEISLLNVSRENVKIVAFQAFGLANGVKMGGSTAFTTAPQQAIADEEMTTAQKMESEIHSEKKLEALKNIQQ